ncbi:DCN1-like protein 5 [Coemansia sp. RSA 376]|nr:DCN1-like protein 5 [Coemansia sp. S680]KAJ2035008.1 DCN1-like protein 5 [Coemansia sp. S3946]KAJ2261483.1 DCN1-like protein 5 [Coemansia sp. RSA 376]KAJ2336415.1 DCN1-like protein 5 [Coemansia sp. RSA 2673]
MATLNAREEWFREYQDYNRDDGRQVIGLEGFQRLCDALKCDMEGLEPMVLSWKLGADELGTVELETWDSKICEMGVTDNAALKKAIDTTVAKFKTDFASYRSFYRKMFDYLKTTPNQKLVPVENVKETLALITNQHWLFMRFIEFLNAQGKAVPSLTRDQWNLLLELSKSVDPKFSTYSKEEAWPSLFDDFYDWVLAHPVSDPEPIDTISCRL